MIMASMRNWLHGDDSQGGDDGPERRRKSERVVVVHCKAGKGRSGTMACSYLISECGWKPKDALARFTERRMRPKFGSGVSIPSQLRWISYVDRWTQHGKKYADREVEVVEIHVWGLRHGVKLSIEGFIEQGKKIKVLHTFRKDERIVVEGDAPGSGGFTEMLSDMAGYVKADSATALDADSDKVPGEDGRGESSTPASSKSKSSSRLRIQTPNLSESRSKSSQSISKLAAGDQSKTIATPGLLQDSAAPNGSVSCSSSSTNLQNAISYADSSEPGGQAVIFKPNERIKVPTSDVNIAVERRNRTPGTMGLTMVTAVAHVWFNVFFEGRGPEQDGKPDDNGVFAIEWDEMDGIKGSSRKGTRAFDQLAVVWRVFEPETGVQTQKKEGVIVNEPGVDSPVPQMDAANWKGGNEEDPSAQKHLGLRVENPASGDASKASSVKSQDIGPSGNDNDSMKGVKFSGPSGEAAPDEENGTGPTGTEPRSASSGSSANNVADATAQKGFMVE